MQMVVFGWKPSYYGFGFQHKGQKMDIEEFEKKVQPGAKRSRLEPFQVQIFELKAKRYTNWQVCEWLAANGVNVSQEAVRKFIKSREEMERENAQNSNLGGTANVGLHKPNIAKNESIGLHKPTPSNESENGLRNPEITNKTIIGMHNPIIEEHSTSQEMQNSSAIISKKDLEKKAGRYFKTSIGNLDIDNLVNKKKDDEK